MLNLSVEFRLRGIELQPEDFVRKKAYEEVQVAIIKSLATEEERSKVRLEFIPAYL